jgi:hypothetical protein
VESDADARACRQPCQHARQRLGALARRKSLARRKLAAAKGDTLCTRSHGAGLYRATNFTVLFFSFFIPTIRQFSTRIVCIEKDQDT